MFANKLSTEVEARIIEAEQVIRLIKPGMRIFIEHGPAEPTVLIKELVKQADNISNITLISSPVPNMNNAPYADSKFQNNWKICSFMGSRQLSKGVEDGIVEYIPAHISEIPIILDTTLRPDIAFVQVSPPDSAGFCNLGVTAETTRAAIDAADIVIAQMNSRMPITSGATSLHISEITHLVEAEANMLEFPSSNPGEAENTIAEQIVPLIPDGATIQVGIGTVPDAILSRLENKLELGIHSGLISDKMMELMKAGVITGNRKRINRGKTVGGMLLGSQELYNYSDRNPTIEIHPVSYINNIYLAKELDNFIAINSAIEVDLTGQINCESLGGKQIAGIGGQQDFMRMARLSHGGKSIIALTSTARGKSKIISCLPQNTPVSTARVDVDLVVTEYGIADLRHQSVRERARRLASIAHPDFRQELMQWIDANLN